MAAGLHLHQGIVPSQGTRQHRTHRPKHWNEPSPRHYNRPPPQLHAVGDKSYSCHTQPSRPNHNLRNRSGRERISSNSDTRE